MDNLNEYSQAELIARLIELENLVKVYQAEKDTQELLQFPWIGNLGHWYFDLKANWVVCNIHKFNALGFSKEEIPDRIGFEFFTDKLHPDDYEPVMENMRRHLKNESPAYEVTYRIQAKDGSWKWYYDRGKVTRWDETGQAEMVVGIVFDVTEQKRIELLLAKQNEQLLEASRIDYLTGVLNRRALNEKLEYEIIRVDRNKRPLSVLLLDVDHFKNINDTYGHMIGDDVLIQMAGVVKKNIRVMDMVGRYGGEEFLVVLPECNQQAASIVAEKIRKGIEQTAFETGIHVTISGGIQEYHGGSLTALINQADQALYQAKEKGRNQIVLA